MTDNLPPLDPNSSNARVPLIAKAREIAAHRITPRKLLDLWPTATTVREVYAAIAACNEVGIEQPTYFEMSCIAGVSLPSVTNALRKLETAGVVVKTREKCVVRGIRYNYALPPLDSDYGRLK